MTTPGLYPSETPQKPELEENKLKQLYDFIESIEALTKDPDTAARIRAFLVQEGIWQ